MFREMRRKRQMLSEDDCKIILREGTSGVLALSGDDGYPYAVPLSYVYDGRRYFFTARNQDTSWTPSGEIRRLPSA